MLTPLKEVLDKLIEVEGIEAALLSSRDGLLIDGVTADGSDLETLAAVGTYGMQAVRRMSELSEHGHPLGITVESERGFVAIQPLSDLAILIVVFNDSINLGYVRFLLGRFKRRMLEILASTSLEP